MSCPRKNARSIAKMTTKELDALVAEFVADSFGPMDSKARARLSRAKRKRGRPRVGAGSQVVSVTIEKRLLKKVDRLAKRLGVSRAKLIAVGLLKITKAAEPLE